MGFTDPGDQGNSGPPRHWCPVLVGPGIRRATLVSLSLSVALALAMKRFDYNQHFLNHLIIISGKNGR